MTVLIRPYRRDVTGTKWEADIRFTWPEDRTTYRERVKAPVTSRSAALRWGAAREVALLAQGKAGAATQKAGASAASGETVEEYAKRWLTDREARGLSSVRDDRSRMKHHVLPVLGLLDARTFGQDDVERLRDILDDKIKLAPDVEGHLSWKTAGNVWALVTSMCSDMVSAKKRDLRTRKDNPCKDVRPPDRGVRKAKQYLYPSEFLALASSEAVPLQWRRAVAVAVYTFLRDGELRALTWQDGDVDLEHGVLSVTRSRDRKTGKSKPTKTGHTRRFAIEPELLPLLRALHEEAKGDDDAATGPVARLASERAMARNLRRWLWKAGVRRPELHQGSPTRKPLTWHDLRATGATWMAVRGDDPLKIKQRCGHTSFDTTELYIREAEAIREGFGQAFPALPLALVCPPARGEAGEERAAE